MKINGTAALQRQQRERDRERERERKRERERERECPRHVEGLLCMYRLVERKCEEGKATRGMERSWERTRWRCAAIQ